MQGLELCKDRNSGETFPRSTEFATRVAMEAVERGVWVYPCGSGPVADGLLISPPYTITEDEIEIVVGVTRDAIAAAVSNLD